MSGRLMAEDMAAQPETLARLAGRREELAAAVRAVAPERPAGTVIVARGSSDYAALYGRYLVELATGRPVAMAAPSLTTLYDAHTDLDGWLAIGVSQSGATPEIVTVLERFAAAGAATLSMTNVPDSPLGSAAAATVALEAGDERAVPATKTFTAQLLAFAAIAEALGPVPWSQGDWDRAPDAVARVLADPDPARNAAGALAGHDELVVLGRGLLGPIALEAALKMREAAGIRAEGWSAADFRHGPITVAGAALPALTLRVAGPAAADVEALMGELRERGARVAAITDAAGAGDLAIPGGLSEAMAAVPAAVRAQQLALELALARGLDPDHPAALSKVTETR